jgi:hypothetical protein
MWQVFLDEAHTRGVDLKLPPKAVGAVTLALKLTKDYLVQGILTNPPIQSRIQQVLARGIC